MEDDEKWYRMAYMGYELEQEDWREESRARVEEAIKKGRYQGSMQTKANMEALEAVKAELQKPSQELPKACANGCDD